ncbi:MAG: tRNA (guanosine(37)-N1)-methyltransferase TrmD, partial [Myxococcales bacterium]|nr:tRNA (guanosine(37)-N1)-methyltransferase TrmD [Myxococcales bacterium]
LFTAIEAVQPRADEPATVVLLTPQGRPLTRALVADLAAHPRLLLVCGRYEGIDERVRAHLVDVEVSVGDVVVSGGELPAMLLLDAVARQVPGVLGSEASLEEESFEGGLLEYPHYTRPAEFRGMGVPEVLLSGDHAKIRAWRLEQARARTAARRPDLLEKKSS